MKVLFVNDFSIKDLQGGATITNKLMVNAGKARGHVISEMTPKHVVIQGSCIDDIRLLKDEDKDSLLNELTKQIKEYDLLILNNISMFPIEVLEIIIAQTKYVKHEHDYCFCNHRNGKCETCKIKCRPAPFFVRLFSNSLLNIFFSPLQLKIFSKFFGETMRDAIIIPAPMERGKFFKKPEIQKEIHLFAGALMTHKGIHQVLDYADLKKKEGQRFHFAGRAVDQAVINRIKKDHTYLGEIPYDKMPELYQNYKYFIINPQMPETFCLTVLEALNSGCELIKFERSHDIGMESYDKGVKELTEMCYEAPTVFWERVESAMQK
ncbi:unnamed protein product [marine sediment metagenome]|uniref:Glycosyl transferase family 1 domain-containing protein n=1 Tax=marine sediment metagenome TaxID=412755 RepID=X0RXI2_9ZZZZ